MKSGTTWAQTRLIAYRRTRKRRRTNVPKGLGQARGVVLGDALLGALDDPVARGDNRHALSRADFSAYIDASFLVHARDG